MYTRHFTHCTAVNFNSTQSNHHATTVNHHFINELVTWSLTSLFSTDMAISEKKGQGVKSYRYPVQEDQRYINLNSGRLFNQQPPKEGKGVTG